MDTDCNRTRLSDMPPVDDDAPTTDEQLARVDDTAPGTTTDTTTVDGGTGGTARRSPKSHRPTEAQRCRAKSRWTGERCKNYAIRGTTVCRYHGGKAPQVEKAGVRRAQRDKAQAAVEKELAGRQPKAIADPFDALHQLAGEATALKDALGARVNALQELRYEASGVGTEQIRGEIQLYERALDRAGKLVKLLIDTGFQERRVRVTEAQAVQVAEVIRRVLERLDLDDNQRGLVRHVVPQELRALDTNDERE